MQDIAILPQGAGCLTEDLATINHCIVGTPYQPLLYKAMVKGGHVYVILFSRSEPLDRVTSVPYQGNYLRSLVFIICVFATCAAMGWLVTLPALTTFGRHGIVCYAACANNVCFSSPLCLYHSPERPKRGNENGGSPPTCSVLGVAAYDTCTAWWYSCSFALFLDG